MAIRVSPLTTTVMNALDSSRAGAASVAGVGAAVGSGAADGVAARIDDGSVDPGLAGAATGAGAAIGARAATGAGVGTARGGVAAGGAATVPPPGQATTSVRVGIVPGGGRPVFMPQPRAA